MNKRSLLVTTACLMLFFVFLPPSNKAWLYKWENFLGFDKQEGVSDRFPAGDHKAIQEEADRSSEEPTGASSHLAANQKTGREHPAASIATVSRQGTEFIRLSDIKNRLPIGAKLDKENGKIVITYQNHSLEMVHGIPVLNKNGIFEPLEAAPYIAQNEAWIPASFVQKVLGQQLVIREGKAEWKSEPSSIPAFAAKPKFPHYSVQQMADYLSFLQTPIPGAHVSIRDSHLPGAPRTYRGGVHEGVDWYSYGSGIKIDKTTPVYSMADGVVVRADTNYKEMTTAQREKLLAKGLNNHGQTPEPILDKLRGRSVWIQYGKGVMARYVHLDRIASNVKVGQKIKAGELVGYVGNSGTSDGAKGNNLGLHLHLDIFVYGEWFWKYYTMNERRMILEEVFNK